MAEDQWRKCSRLGPRLGLWTDFILDLVMHGLDYGYVLWAVPVVNAALPSTQITSHTASELCASYFVDNG